MRSFIMSSQMFWVSWDVSRVLRRFEFHETFHEFSDVTSLMRRFIMSSQMFWVSWDVSWVLRRYEFHETFHNEFSDVLSFTRRFMSSQTFWVSREVSWVLRRFVFHETFHEFSDVTSFMRRFMNPQHSEKKGHVFTRVELLVDFYSVQRVDKAWITRDSFFPKAFLCDVTSVLQLRQLRHQKNPRRWNFRMARYITFVFDCRREI